jgi:hypothetical protein
LYVCNEIYLEFDNISISIGPPVFHKPLHSSTF